MKKHGKSLGLIALGALIAIGISNYLPTVSRNDSTGSLIKDVQSKTTKFAVDVDYYKDFEIYAHLLEFDDFQKMKEVTGALEDNEEFMNYATLVYLSALSRENSEFENKIKAVIDIVKKNKTDNSSFEQDATCAKLIPGIKETLDKQTTGTSREKEELVFIFFSPSLQSCLYVTEHADYDKSYSSTRYKTVYNANTSTKIEQYRVYTSDDYDNPEEDRVSDRNSSNFVRYILENSNYNVDLLKEVSFL